MQWRTPITLSVLVLMLLGAAYYGWQSVVNPSTGSDTTAPPPSHSSETTPNGRRLVCLKHSTVPRGTVIRATRFTVNVFNAGAENGQAAAVLAALHARGFREGVAANPPPQVHALNVTIFVPSRNAPRARLVAAQFRGPVRLTPGPNLANGTDVVIGPKFVGLQPNAPRTLTVKQPTRICLKYARRPGRSES